MTSFMEFMLLADSSTILIKYTSSHVCLTFSVYVSKIDFLEKLSAKRDVHATKSMFLFFLPSVNFSFVANSDWLMAEKPFPKICNDLHPNQLPHNKV